MYWKKGLVTLLILIIGITAYTGIFDRVFVGKTFIGGIDRNAEAYLDKTMKKALVTFAVVRGINAVISVIQESDLAVSPAGVGMTIAVGEILDPVNDLIERFSWIMLASTTSLGVQRILMNISAWLGFRFLLTLSMFAVLIGLWLPHLFKRDLKSLGIRLLLLSILVRFIVPVVALATDRIDGLFLERTYTRATQNLEQVSQEISRDDSVNKPADDRKILGKVRAFFENIRDAVNLEQRIQLIRDKVAHYIDYIVDLIVVFTLQTILIPLLILWILVKLFGNLLNIQLEDSLKSLWNRTTHKPGPTLVKE